MKGSIHVCDVKEKLYHTLPPRRSELDDGKLNASMIISYVPKHMQL